MVPNAFHVPGSPAVTQIHPAVPAASGVVFQTMSPRAAVPVEGAAVPHVTFFWVADQTVPNGSHVPAEPATVQTQPTVAAAAGVIFQQMSPTLYGPPAEGMAVAQYIFCAMLSVVEKFCMVVVLSLALA